MLVNVIKIATKIALIAVITAAIIALFTTIQIPELDYTLFSEGIGKALAMCNHFCPAFEIIFPAALILLGIQISILVFKIGAIVWKWVFKVME